MKTILSSLVAVTLFAGAANAVGPHDEFTDPRLALPHSEKFDPFNDPRQALPRSEKVDPFNDPRQATPFTEEIWPDITVAQP